MNVRLDDLTFHSLKFAALHTQRPDPRTAQLLSDRELTPLSQVMTGHQLICKTTAPYPEHSLQW